MRISIGILIFLLGLQAQAPAQAQGLLPNAQQTFVDGNGVPLAGGKVFTYIPNSTTPKTTYQDSALTVPNANPIILDAAGRATIWGTGLYREIVQDFLGVQQWDLVTSTGQVAGPIAPSTPGDLVIFDSNTGKSLADSGIPNTVILQHLANNAALNTAAATVSPVVVRDSFATLGDSPPLTYRLSQLACPLNAGAGDGGAQVQAPGGKCWLAQFPGYIDIKWYGAKDDAVPGPVGNACSGITGTDNIGAFNAAYSYALANRISLFGGGTGIYRLNSKWTLTGFNSPQPWNSNTQNPVKVNIEAPIVTCGSDAGVLLQTGESYGMELHLARLIGPGAASSAPTPFGGAENIGLYISGTSNENVSIGMISDYTYDLLLDNSFSNKIFANDMLAAYKVVYLRDGVCGAGCSTQNNVIEYTQIGGVFTFNGDPNFTARQTRSANWGVHIAGSGGGNVLTGGAIQYNLKGTAGINLEVDTDHNYITTWLEGNNGVNGKNLVVGGNYNTFQLSDMASPSSGMTTNVSVSGVGNNLFGPVIGDPIDLTWGAITVNGTNFINNNPVGVNAGGLSFSCTVGAPVNITGTARYKKIGGLIYYEALIFATDIGTCGGEVDILNLPAAASPTRKDVLPGTSNSGLGLQCIALPGTTHMAILKQAGTFPFASGDTGQCSGWYNAE